MGSAHGLAGARGLLVALGCGGGDGGGASRARVVLYTSLDEPFSRPLAEEFERTTGITVEFLTDDEVDKSVGIAGRIKAERANPLCDVHWNNEPGNTEVLRTAGLYDAYKSPAASGIPDRWLDADGYWTGLAARARVILVNTDLVKPAEMPTGLADLARFGKRAGIARPVAGTTATHAAILYVLWGEEKAREFFRGLAAAGVTICDGNAHVKNQVADGELAIGLTDSDDANLALRAGKPVRVVYPDQGEGGMGTPVLPNTVALVRGAPHPAEARKLIDFLSRREVEERLAAGESAQLPLHAGATLPASRTPGLEYDLAKIRHPAIDWRAVGERLPGVIEEMKQLFQR